MKVKYTGENDPLVLLNNKVYNVLSVGDYLYPPEAFEITEK
ncbi:hypothetical protein [Clostridium sp. JN-1]|jgi:hypothetical protein|nr:hypothetical protein [Clostridium sp. JN-1]